MDTSTKGNGRMVKEMVKESLLYLMEISTKENGRMGKNMVKEPILSIMEISTKENGRMELMVELRNQKNQKEILILQLQYYQR